MARTKLLLVPAVVVTLCVPAADATARKKNNGKWSDAPGHSRVAPGNGNAADHRAAGHGDGRRMR